LGGRNGIRPVKKWGNSQLTMYGKMFFCNHHQLILMADFHVKIINLSLLVSLPFYFSSCSRREALVDKWRRFQGLDDLPVS